MRSSVREGLGAVYRSPGGGEMGRGRRVGGILQTDSGRTATVRQSGRLPPAGKNPICRIHYTVPGPKSLLTNSIENDFQFQLMSHSASSSPSIHASDQRCQCGNLLARLRPKGVELKCRRCKRVVVIPWQAAGAWYDLSVRWHEKEQKGGNTDLS